MGVVVAPPPPEAEGVAAESRRAVKEGSEVKSAVIVAFLHSERDGPAPETKFTAEHF